MVALDYESLQPALAMARQLRGPAGLVKVGSQLFTSEGPRAVQKLAGLEFGVFLDLKYHDIPNTVAGAVAAAAALPGVRMMTLHAAGGLKIGVQGPPGTRVLALARLAQEAGLDGVVASAHEARPYAVPAGHAS